MKHCKKITPHRKRRFLMEFRRYLQRYLDHPVIRNRYRKSTETE